MRIALLTALLAIAAIAIALPLQRSRERRMVDAARAELASVSRAVEEYRAQHYRLPDGLDELEPAGYTVTPAIEVCAFRHVVDPRGFDDHVEITLRHRASGNAIQARYPAVGGSREIDADEACERDAASAAATRGRQP